MSSRASSSRVHASKAPKHAPKPYTSAELCRLITSQQEAVSGDVIVTTARSLLSEALWDFRQKYPVKDRSWDLDFESVKVHVKQMCEYIVHRAAAEKMLTDAQLSCRLPKIAKDDFNYFRGHFLDWARGLADDLMTNTAYDVEQVVEMCRIYRHRVSFPAEWYSCFLDPLSLE